MKCGWVNDDPWSLPAICPNLIPMSGCLGDCAVTESEEGLTPMAVHPPTGQEPTYFAVGFMTRGDEKIGDSGLAEITGIEIDSLAPNSASRVRAVHFERHAIGLSQARGIRATWHRSSPTARLMAVYVLVRRGSIELFDETGTLSMTEGDIALVSPNTGSVKWDVERSAEVACIGFAPEDSPADSSKVPIRKLSPGSAMFQATYTFLASAAQAPADADATEIALLHELTLNAAQALIRASRPELPADDLAGRALEVLQARFHSAIFGIDDVARELQTSRRSLERAASNRGFSLSEELNLLRTRHAVNLLTDQPETPIAEIAAASGFGSAEVMRRAFQRHLNQNPARVRGSLQPTASETPLDE